MSQLNQFCRLGCYCCTASAGCPCSFHPERDSDLQELDQLAGTAATGDDDMDSDEDIVVTTGEVNQKCPYTMKEVSSWSSMLLL